jgi:hypothetical protein
MVDHSSMDLDDVQRAHQEERAQFALVSNPVLRRIFFLIRSLGIIIMFVSVVTEYAYLFKHKFSSITFFVLYSTTCLVKLVVPLIIILISLKRNVIGKVPKSFTYDID